MKRLIALLLLLGLAPFSTAALVTSGLIIQLDAGTLSLNDGDSVTTWADSATTDTVNGSVSLQGSIATQTVTAPIFRTNVLNGLAAVQFSGANPNVGNALLSAGWTMPVRGDGFTVFSVFTGGLSTASAGERLFQVGAKQAAGKVLVADVSAASAGDSGARFNNGSAVTTAGNNPLTSGFHVAAWKIDHAARYDSLYYAVDGTQVTGLTYGTSAATLTNFDSAANANVLSIGDGLQNSQTLGNAWSVNDFYTGYLAELLVYNAQLTPAQIDEVNAYLMGKYAIPEPATLLLLGLGSLVAIRCKRA